MKLALTADEHWKISLATASGKAIIEKNYHPTIAVKVVPEVLAELYRIVKDSLSQGLDSSKKDMYTASLQKNQVQYFVAYIPTRLRR
jgi:hypothetical protein